MIKATHEQAKVASILAQNLTRSAFGDPDSTLIANNVLLHASTIEVRLAAAWTIRTRTGIPMRPEHLKAKQALLKRIWSPKG